MTDTVPTITPADEGCWFTGSYVDDGYDTRIVIGRYYS